MNGESGAPQSGAGIVSTGNGITHSLTDMERADGNLYQHKTPFSRLFLVMQPLTKNLDAQDLTLRNNLTTPPAPSQARASEDIMAQQQITKQGLDLIKEVLEQAAREEVAGLPAHHSDISHRLLANIRDEYGSLRYPACAALVAFEYFIN